MRTPHARQLSAAVVLLSLVSACGSGGGASTSAGPGAAQGAGATVSLRGLKFVPATITVAAGQPVVWRDDEDVTHTVTTGSWTAGGDGTRTSEHPDGKLDKVVNGAGSTVSYVFAQPGRYQYFCAYHSAMQGVVVVR